MAVTIPTKTQINMVTTGEPVGYYSAKSNLKESTGSFMRQATMLVYDDILRFQKTPKGYFTDAEIADFVYHAFEGNVLWFMDELVGMESDWKKYAKNSKTGAYGYVQFLNKDTVQTAVNRYINHVERFNINESNNDRSYMGMIMKFAESTGLSTIANPLDIIQIPFFVSNLKKKLDANTYNHEADIDGLTYDQLLALAFVHLHSKDSKDSNFRLLSFGDVTAAKDIYKENHHTNPDAETLNRLTGFFKIHYKPAAKDWPKLREILPGALLAHELYQEFKNSKWWDHLSALKARFGW